MRNIDVKVVTEAVSKLCKDSCYYLPDEMMAVLENRDITNFFELALNIVTFW